MLRTTQPSPAGGGLKDIPRTGVIGEGEYREQGESHRLGGERLRTGGDRLNEKEKKKKRGWCETGTGTHRRTKEADEEADTSKTQEKKMQRRRRGPRTRKPDGRMMDKASKTNKNETVEKKKSNSPETRRSPARRRISGEF